MQLKQFITADDRAVSPVIGVILMVAITVILAAVIGTFVLGLGENVQNTSPSASFSFDYTPDDGSTAGFIEITHESGDAITASQVEIRADQDIEGSNGAATNGDGTLTLDGSDSDGLSVSGDLTAGTVVSVYESDGGGDGTAQFDTVTLRVVWQSQGGDNSATLGQFSGPDA